MRANHLPVTAGVMEIVTIAHAGRDFEGELRGNRS
jgi:hypothetical protein